MSRNKPKHVEIWTYHYYYHWPLKGNIIFFTFLYPISIGWPDHRPSCVDIELKMPWISAASKSLDYSDNCSTIPILMRIILLKLLCCDHRDWGCYSLSPGNGKLGRNYPAAICIICIVESVTEIIAKLGLFWILHQ